MFGNQGYHLLVWGVVGSLLYAATRASPGEAEARAWGWPASTWLILSWVFAGLHQGWVWFFWRMELHRGRIRAWFGERGFLLLRVGFVLFASCCSPPHGPSSCWSSTTRVCCSTAGWA